MKNNKTLIIVESVGKVEAIQKYLGDQYIVCASNGQIVELAKGGRFGIGVNPIADFKPYYKLIVDKIHFLDKVISNADAIEKIIICTDPDTEGHGIAWHIAQSLKHLNKPMHRAEFHEITKDGIEHGMSHITDVDLNKFKAQETRRILDRLVGFMVSPFLINYYKTNLSAGRVQSVATKMVIEREKEITGFQPQEYWNMNVKLIKENQPLIVKYQNKIKSKDDALKIKLQLEQPSINDSMFEAIEVVRKSKAESPPPPLTTARMQQLMASKFGIEGEATMQAAQSLYELGLVTYIRTDSTRISESALDNVRDWLQNHNYDIPKKPNLFKNKDAAQNAHECIRPTNLDNLPDNINLGENVKNLYKLIWTYFVASQMCSSIYDTLNVKIVHRNSEHKFKVAGKVLTSPGYLSLLEGKEKSDGELPQINKNDTFHLFDNNSIVLEQKFTQPPRRYSYGSLIEDLESKGIGRPSTYVEIISKITNRNYVEKQGSMYYGTELGTKITDLLSKYFDFMNYDYTSELEKKMDDISIGSANSMDVLHDFYNSFKMKLKDAHIEAGGKSCDKCMAPMYMKTSKSGDSFWGCSLYPFCNHTVDGEIKKCA